MDPTGAAFGRRVVPARCVGDGAEGKWRRPVADAAARGLGPAWLPDRAPVRRAQARLAGGVDADCPGAVADDRLDEDDATGAGEARQMGRPRNARGRSRAAARNDISARAERRSIERGRARKEVWGERAKGASSCAFSRQSCSSKYLDQAGGCERHVRPFSFRKAYYETTIVR